MVRPSRFNQPTSGTLAGASNPSPTSHNTSDRAPAAGRASASYVIGPTSALTSFLREQGIRPANVNRFAPRQPQPSSSTAVPTVAEEEESKVADRLTESDPDSDDLDEGSETRNNQGRSNKNGKQTNGSPKVSKPIALSPQASKSIASSSKKKNSPPEDPDPIKPKPGKYADRNPGSITTCAECGKRFTVTHQTTQAQGDQAGQLCAGCAQEVKKNPKSRTKDDNLPAPKKRKTKKNQIVRQPWSENSIQTLQMACIKVIAENIQSIEALGYIGSVNLEQICKIVCKHRELTPSNFTLFVDTAYSDLKLFDCINLRESNLKSIAFFCPHLQKLTLNLCGHMTGEVLETYAERLHSLRELDLFGPYLVRKPSWLKTFEIWNTPRLVSRSNKENEKDEDVSTEEVDVPEEYELHQSLQIVRFRLKQSPRFDLDCTKALVSSCKNLTSLRLEDIGLLNDQTLDVISGARLNQLKDLSISNAGILNGATGEALTDLAVIGLIKSVGSTVESLDISQNKKLTDQVLQGIHSFCQKLTYMNLSGLQEITTIGVQELFSKLKEFDRPGLKYLNLSRCIKVGNEALYSIIQHSGKTLTFLDLNSVDELRTEALERLAHQAKHLESLDVSFVRDVDDFIIKSFLDHMQNLRTVYVYGNNRVSDLCPTKRGVMIKGQERSIVVN